MQGAARRTYLLALEHCRVRPHAGRKNKTSAHILGEERAVKRLQVMGQLIGTDLLLRRTPAGGVALATMDHRQMQPVQIGFTQVIVMPKLRFSIQHSHHAAQLT